MTCAAFPCFLSCGGGARGDESRERRWRKDCRYNRDCSVCEVCQCGLAARVCLGTALQCPQRCSEGSRMQRGAAQCGCYPCCLTCARDSKPIKRSTGVCCLSGRRPRACPILSNPPGVALTRSTRLCRDKYSCDRCIIRVPRRHDIEPQQVQKPLKRSVGSAETAFNSSAAWFL